MVALVGEDILMSASDDITIAFASLSTGICLARAGDFGMGVESTTITPDGRIACGGNSSKAAIMSPPTLVANALKEHAALLYPPPSSLAIIHEPLQNAMIAVTAGLRSAGDACRDLVTEKNCSVSVEEWWCAHRLLMVAVRNAEIEGELHFEGSKNHWFLKLYTSSRCFALGPDDWEKFRRCVSEAKEAGVISEPEAVLGGVLVGQDLLREVTSLEDAGQNMLSLLSQVLIDQAAADEEMKRLGEKLTAVERVQKVNALLTAVFSFAPLGGATAANAITALGEALPLLENILSTAEGVRGAATPCILDKFIGRSSVLIARDMWEKVPSENRVAIREAAEGLGMSWEEFCVMIGRAAVQRAVKIDEHGKDEADGAGDEHCPDAVDDVADSVQDVTASSAFNDGSVTGGANAGATGGPQTIIDSEFGSVSSNLRDRADDLVCDLQELKTASANTVAMKSMTNDMLSKIVAGIMIDCEDDLRSSFPILARCLRSAFRKISITGNFLVGFSDKEYILKMVVVTLKEDATYCEFDDHVSKGLEWRLQQFLQTLSG